MNGTVVPPRPGLAAYNRMRVALAQESCMVVGVSRMVRVVGRSAR